MPLPSAAEGKGKMFGLIPSNTTNSIGVNGEIEKWIERKKGMGKGNKMWNGVAMDSRLTARGKW